MYYHITFLPSDYRSTPFNNFIMPRKKPPPKSSIAFSLKKQNTTQSHAYLDPFHLLLKATPFNCCPFPLCFRHKQPFKRKQDYMRHLNTEKCISKLKSYCATTVLSSMPTTTTDHIGPSTELDKFNIHVNNIPTTTNYTTQTQNNIMHPSTILQQHPTINNNNEEYPVAQYPIAEEEIDHYTMLTTNKIPTRCLHSPLIRNPLSVSCPYLTT